MTTLELKTQIQHELENVPEAVLQSVLDFVKQVQHQSPEQTRRDVNFRKILSEDKGLLNRLAK